MDQERFALKCKKTGAYMRSSNPGLNEALSYLEITLNERGAAMAKYKDELVTTRNYLNSTYKFFNFQIVRVTL